MPAIHMKEETTQQLQYPIVTFDYSPVSWDHYKSASYEFDFSELTWKREMKEFFDLKTAGEISREIAESFLGKIQFVCGLSDETSYYTESERDVPATPGERNFLQRDIKRLAQYRAVIRDKYFRWVPELDTEAPYNKLTAAFEGLLTELDI